MITLPGLVVTELVAQLLNHAAAKAKEPLESWMETILVREAFTKLGPGHPASIALRDHLLQNRSSDNGA